MAQTQFRHPTRYEILRRDYVNDLITSAQFERAVESLIALGKMDEICPFHPTQGWRWAYRLAL